MATCDHAAFVAFPPTFEFLLLNSSQIAVNDDIQRNRPRCKLCDLIIAQTLQEEALSIDISRAFWKAEKDIKATQELLHRGVLVKEQIETTMLQLEKSLEEASEARDSKIAEPWYKYWVIWGLPETSDTTNDLSWEEYGIDVSIPTPAAEIPAKQSTKSVEAVDEITWEENEDDSISAQDTLPLPADTKPASKKRKSSARAHGGRKRAKK